MKAVKVPRTFSGLVADAVAFSEASFSNGHRRPKQQAATTGTYSLNGRQVWGPIETGFTNSTFVLAYKEQLAIFFDQIQKVDSFLDVGCGRGNMLAIAKKFNPDIKASGIECCANLAKSARQHGGVWHGDALEFKQYSKFSLIYMYRPLVEACSQAFLEERVIKQMRPGSMLISIKPQASKLLRSVSVEKKFASRGVFVKE